MSKRKFIVRASRDAAYEAIVEASSFEEALSEAKRETTSFSLIHSEPVLNGNEVDFFEIQDRDSYIVTEYEEGKALLLSVIEADKELQEFIKENNE